MSNRTTTDVRAARLLDSRGRSWYLGQHDLPEQQAMTMLELDTLS